MRRYDTVEAVINILNEQISVFRMLVDLLQRACFSDMNVSGVEAMLRERDNLISRSRLLEEKRTRLLSESFKGDVSLQRLGELTGDNTFFEIRSKLLSLLQSIDELNQFRPAIGNFSDHLKTTTVFLGFPVRNMAAGADI